MAFLGLHAQVYVGSSEWESQKRDALYTYANGDFASVSKFMEAQLKGLGSLSKQKSTWLVANPRIPGASNGFKQLGLRLEEQGEKTKIWAFFINSTGNFLKKSDALYADAEAWLEACLTQLKSQQRLDQQQGALERLKAEKIKQERMADRLIRSMEANARQLSLLLEKLEENKKEKEKLKTEQVQVEMNLKRLQSELIEQEKQINTTKNTKP